MQGVQRVGFTCDHFGQLVDAFAGLSAWRTLRKMPQRGRAVCLSKYPVVGVGFDIAGHFDGYFGCAFIRQNQQRVVLVLVFK